jgi:hypothetical protein
LDEPCELLPGAGCKASREFRGHHIYFQRDKKFPNKIYSYKYLSP